MNIDKLEVGKTFKNYKVMCEELGLKVKSGGNSRRHQFKELSQYCLFEKEGQKIIIIEVHETPKPKIDGRGKSFGSRYGNKFKTPLYITNPKLAEQWLVEENGMELPDEVTKTVNVKFWWKCTNCHHKIFSSPAKRFNKCKGNDDDFITCPYCSLSKGARVIYDFLEVNNISFKLEYMFNDLIGLGKKKLRFDFALFNDNQELISLIEFDGGYHDEELNPDSEKHKIVSAHDTLKDHYCLKNDISLLRIHHRDSDKIVTILSNYILTVNIPQAIKDNVSNALRQSLINTILIYEDKKKSLEIELLKIENTLNDLKSLMG